MKKVCKVLAATAATTLLLSVTAMADPALNVAKSGNNVTATVSGLSANEESTLLVVKSGTDLSKLDQNEDAIFYIDQATATEGTATYTFSVEGLSGNVVVYSGYESMTANSSPMSKLVEEQGTGDGDSGSSGNPEEPANFKYGDVNNDGAVDASDASAIIDNFLNGAAFYDKNTDEVYAYGVQAADVDASNSVDASDASAIIDYFLSGVKLPVNSK